MSRGLPYGSLNNPERFRNNPNISFERADRTGRWAAARRLCERARTRSRKEASTFNVAAKMRSLRHYGRPSSLTSDFHPPYR